MSKYWPAPDETGGTTTKPGIYRFDIDEYWIYFGRFTKASRPLKEYERNVRKLIERRPYRPQNPRGFRAVHLALYWALVEERTIRLSIVENVSPERLNERERFWISGAPPQRLLNGKGLFVPNARD